MTPCSLSGVACGVVRLSRNLREGRYPGFAGVCLRLGGEGVDAGGGGPGSGTVGGVSSGVGVTSSPRGVQFGGMGPSGWRVTSAGGGGARLTCSPDFIRTASSLSSLSISLL